MVNLYNDTTSTVWREILVDLANDHKFAKVSSAKIPCSILNNIINVQIHHSLFRQDFAANLPKFPSIWY